MKKAWIAVLILAALAIAEKAMGWDVLSLQSGNGRQKLQEPVFYLRLTGGESFETQNRGIYAAFGGKWIHDQEQTVSFRNAAGEGADL